MFCTGISQHIPAYTWYITGHFPCPVYIDINLYIPRIYCYIPVQTSNILVYTYISTYTIQNIPGIYAYIIGVSRVIFNALSYGRELKGISTNSYPSFVSNHISLGYSRILEFISLVSWDFRLSVF